MKQEMLISASDLGIGYKQGSASTPLYKGLSFNLCAGELTCLLGANGAGKSTLLRTLCGIQPPLEGTISVAGKRLQEHSEQELSQILGLVLTEKISVGGFTVRELASFGRYPYTGFWGRLGKHDKAIVDKALDDVGVSHKADSYMAELSDGERQKVLIAKALAQECPVILLDEPTAFLDITSRMEIMNLLQHLAHQENKAILMSTHEIETVLMLADRLWLLSREKGLTCGVTEDVVLSEAMVNFFDNKKIYFEHDTGKFRMRKDNKGSTFLFAEGELRYWTQNFLQRLGYEVIEDPQQSEVIINVYASNNIAVLKGETKQMFRSFEEFIVFLGSNKDFL